MFDIKKAFYSTAMEDAATNTDAPMLTTIGDSATDLKIFKTR